MLTPRQKLNVIKEFQIKKGDTGSAEVQVALLSREIEELTRHLKKHPKDQHSRRGLLKMVSKRRRLLNWLSRNDKKAYNSMIKKLALKK